MADNNYAYAEDAPMTNQQDSSWDDWDRQAREYLSSPDYSGGSFNTPDGQYWGNTPQFDLQSNLSNMPTQDWMSGQFNTPMTPQETAAARALPETNWNPNALGPIGKTLQDIFSGQGGNAMLKGIGALMEGSQNKRKAQALQNIVSQNKATIDPFGSQRPFYQQQLQSAVQNPYESPIVKAQVEQIAAAQARKDAAAGRRSNMATSSPAMLAAQAQVAQNYMNSLMNPAGAGIAPNSNAMMNMLGQAANADVQGYLSPAMAALGNIQQTNTLADIFKNMSTSDRVALQQALARQGQ